MGEIIVACFLLTHSVVKEVKGFTILLILTVRCDVVDWQLKFVGHETDDSERYKAAEHAR